MQPAPAASDAATSNTALATSHATLTAPSSTNGAAATLITPIVRIPRRPY